MIKSFFIEGLNNQTQQLSLNFHKDINIFTGKNGCGKTTLLKLLWYMSSGKISAAITEIQYKHAELTTDAFFLAIDKSSESVVITYRTPKMSVTQNLPMQQVIDRAVRTVKMENISFDIDVNGNSTIFFPTYRRIEGGFSNRTDRHFRSPMITLKEALTEVASTLSSPKHMFISSISTDDLISLITREYTRISEETNRLQKLQSDRIISSIKDRKRYNNSAEDLLNQIQIDIEGMEQERQEKLKPFSVLTDLINKIFHEKGISFVNLALGGSIKHIVESDKLSAGEKQMLSFLCYNTFSNEQIIFIDEPELSLHPDWQRILIPTLLEQDNKNQFIIATHSPFIYTKYSDKEFILDRDRGF